MNKVRQVTRQCYSEICGNLLRLSEVLAKYDYSTAIALIAVKLMDYSDHLPLAFSPEPIIITDAEGIIGKHMHQLKATCSQQVAWPYEQQKILEISYNASLGDAEMHPHVTHIFLRTQHGQRMLIIRYFDDESTVWQGNPCRASTTTIAELIVNIDQDQLYSVRYFRYRTPKRVKFNRRKTFEKLHSMLNSPRAQVELETRLITFGLEAQNDRFKIFCRYAHRSQKSVLVNSQLAIVSAILQENLLFTRMVLEKFRGRTLSGVLKMTWGKKQLRAHFL